MIIPNKVYQDHKVKSDRVRVLKRKLKNSISVNTLQEMLNHSRSYNISPLVFMGWDTIDDEAYTKACIVKEAREELLEELIKMKSHG